MKNNYERIYKSDPRLLPEIEKFVGSIISKLDIAKTVKNNIELAVAEASANCMLHGNKCNTNKKVVLKISIDNQLIKISFKDEGDGFIIDKLSDPTKTENLLKESGRGIHIIKSVVDKIDYIFDKDGTETVLLFNI